MESNKVSLYRKLSIAGFVSTLLAVALPAAAQTGQYDAITDAVDFSAVSTAIVAIFALVAVMYVTFKGGRMVLRAIK